SLLALRQGPCYKTLSRKHLQPGSLLEKAGTSGMMNPKRADQHGPTTKLNSRTPALNISQDYNLPAFAISPLDGRYRSQLSGLADLVSEAGLVGYRLQVEAGWLLHLVESGITSFSLNDASRDILQNLK